MYLDNLRGAADRLRLYIARVLPIWIGKAISVVSAYQGNMFKNERDRLEVELELEKERGQDTCKRGIRYCGMGRIRAHNAPCRRRRTSSKPREDRSWVGTEKGILFVYVSCWKWGERNRHLTDLLCRPRRKSTIESASKPAYTAQRSDGLFFSSFSSSIYERDPTIPWEKVIRRIKGNRRTDRHIRCQLRG